MKDQDVPVKLMGKELTLRFTTMALVRVEEMRGLPILSLFRKIGSEGLSYGDLLALTWAGLQFHHKDENFTYEYLGDNIPPSELNDGAYHNKMLLAMSIVFPNRKEIEDLAGAAGLNEDSEDPDGETSGEEKAGDETSGT